MKDGKKLYLKVLKKDAESTRKKLYKKKIFDGKRRVIPEKNHLLLPITSKTTLPGTQIVERKVQEIKKKPRSLKEALSGSSPTPSSFDVVGDIAILEFDKDFTGDKKVVARALLDTFPSIKSVAEKSAKVSGEYRVRGISVLAGESRTETVHKEHGCRYKLDVAQAYFSPRLGSERMRVAGQVEEGERVLVLFAGVGPYAILIAKKRKPSEIVAVELNPNACEYMEGNVARNKVKVKVVCGDAKEETPKLGVFDRIVMPLPMLAGDFLDVALPALTTGGVINFYAFAHDPGEAEKTVKEKAAQLKHEAEVLDVVECGSYSPCLSRYCVDFKLGAKST
ncbi:MAG: class I SAM-dependent methyltransferase family protein [Candidatus Altiarchaeota archaeon]